MRFVGNHACRHIRFLIIFRCLYQLFLQRGYLQTFGCETSRNPYLQHLLKITPKNLILAETDNPTAEPWLGGTDTSINLIEKIYADIAKILEMPVGELEKVIFENGKRVLRGIY